MTVRAAEVKAEFHPLDDRERLAQIRRSVVARLSDLEAERARLAAEGHPGKARETLRAFQEVAHILEMIDEILSQ